MLPFSVVVAVVRRAVAAGTVGPVGDWVGSSVAPGVGGLVAVAVAVAVAAPVRRPPLVLTPLAEGGVSLSLSFPFAVVAAAVESAVGESVATIPATVRKAVSTVGASVRQSVSTIAVRAVVRVSFSFGNSRGLSLSLAIVASVGPVAPKVATVRATVANSSVVATVANSVAVAVVRVGLGFRCGSSSGCQSKNKQHLHPCLMIDCCSH